MPAHEYLMLRGRARIQECQSLLGRSMDCCLGLHHGRAVSKMGIAGMNLKKVTGIQESANNNIRTRRGTEMKNVKSSSGSQNATGLRFVRI